MKLPHFKLLNPQRKWPFLAFYLVILYFSSYFFWLFFNAAEIFLTQTAPGIVALAFNQPLSDSPSHDASQITLEYERKLNVLVTIPGGSRVGRTQNDITFSEYPGSSLNNLKILTERIRVDSSNVESRQELVIKNSPIGRYRIKTHSRTGGDFSLKLTATDRSGIYSEVFEKQITLKPGQTVNWQLTYHKDLLRRAKFSRKYWWQL